MKREIVFDGYWLRLMDETIPARDRLMRARFELGIIRREAFSCEQKTKRLRRQARMLKLTVAQLREATTTKQSANTK